MPRVTVTHGPDRTASAEVDSPTTVVQRRSTDARILGSLLVTFGIGWFLRQVGVDLSWEAIVASVLLALGLNMMATPRGGHGTKLWFLGLALTLGLASMSSVSANFPGGGVSDRYVAPTALADLRPHYEQAAGEFVLDLTQVEPWTGERLVEVELGAGQLTVTVPDDVGVAVDAKFTAGEFSMFGEQVAAGLFDKTSKRTQGYETAERKVRLKLTVTAGQILVRHPGDPLLRGDRRGFNFEFEGRGAR